MDILFIGLILVGATLTFKVITEGKTHIAILAQELEKYRNASQQCRVKVEEREAKTHEAKALVEKLQLELASMKSKRDKMRRDVKQLRSKDAH